MKKLLIGAVLIVGVTLYSCGGNSNSSDEQWGNGVVSNAEITPTTLDGKPIPEEKTSADGGSGSGIDVNAPSDDKGVGKFTDVKVDAKIDASMATKGQDLFQTSCTACHTATEKRLIGPGLKGISKIRTPEWIMNMITNPVEMVKKDPISGALFEEFNHIQMTDQGISDDGARQIYEFFRKNDSN